MEDQYFSHIFREETTSQLIPLHERYEDAPEDWDPNMELACKIPIRMESAKPVTLKERVGKISHEPAEEFKKLD